MCVYERVMCVSGGCVRVMCVFVRERMCVCASDVCNCVCVFVCARVKCVCVCVRVTCVCE